MAKDETGEDQINMTIYTTDAIRNRIKAAGALQGKSMSVFVVETVLKELDRLEAAQRETHDFIARHTGESK
jgi:uncharacterized protein (DUF1778 family)